MTQNNPYQTPEAELGAAVVTENTEAIAASQKLIINSFVLYFTAIVLRSAVGPLLNFLPVIALLMSVYGTIKLTRALGKSVLVTVLLTVLMFVPLVNFLVLANLNSQAIKHLKLAGYTIGFLGASKPL